MCVNQVSMETCWLFYLQPQLKLAEHWYCQTDGGSSPPGCNYPLEYSKYPGVFYTAVYLVKDLPLLRRGMKSSRPGHTSFLPAQYVRAFSLQEYLALEVVLNEQSAL